MSQPGLPVFKGYSATVEGEPPPGLTPGKVWEMVMELRSQVQALEARVVELEAHAPGKPAWKAEASGR